MKNKTFILKIEKTMINNCFRSYINLNCYCFVKLFLFLALISIKIFFTSYAFSMALDWSGNYRFEFAKIYYPDLYSSGEKSYFLHHLTLSPKIIVLDQVTIHSKFEILNNKNPFYANNPVGSFLGSGVGKGAKDQEKDQDSSNVVSQNQSLDNVYVSELYLTWKQDFGALIIGRTPIHFGLGMLLNKGEDAFDYWSTNRDLIAYKMISGNLSFIPILAKVSENSTSVNDDVTDYMFIFNYDNEDIFLKFGILYYQRQASSLGNDSPSSISQDTSLTRSGSWNSEYTNIFMERKIGNLNIGFEGGMWKGDTGTKTSKGEEIGVESFAAIFDLDYDNPQSSWSWNFKTGYISGDSGSSESDFEGYLVNRNYDVAFLLFNHPLGNYDIFSTDLSFNRDKSPDVTTRIDDEALSNVIYFSPTLSKKISDKWDFATSFFYGMLNKDPLKDKEISKDIGYEIDFRFNYHPYDNLQWINNVGFFFPGQAFKDIDANFRHNLIYGFTSRIAVSF